MSSDLGHAGEGDAAQCGWRAMFQLVVEKEGHRRFVEAGEAVGLPIGSLKALLQLDPEAPCAMRDLAERFRCDPSYITSLVDDLEKAGLAERRPHPADRRVKEVALTGRGVDALSHVRKIIDEPPDWFSALTANEKEQLRKLLGKLQAAQAQEAEVPREG